MARVHRRRRGFRWVALIQCVLLVPSPGCVPGGAIAPQPGVLQYRLPLMLDVPEGQVNLAGGNLLHRRVDLSIDTLFGSLDVGPVYNSATGQWQWPFEMSYDGQTFLDDSGAVHDLSLLADGDAIPGTHWVKLDAQRVKTKGGLVHHFDADSHRLLAITGVDGVRPALVFFGEAAGAGGVRTRAVSQCRGSNVCRLVYRVSYDEEGCVDGIRDRAGRHAVFQNLANCRPDVARDALDLAQGWPGRRYEYAGGLLTSVTNSEGERVEYTYQDGRLVAVAQSGGEGPLFEFHYGFEPVAELFFSVVEDARGGISIYRYDESQRLHEWRDAAGDSTFTTWSGRRPASRVGPDGARINWVFEEDDPVRIELPSGNIVHFTYAPEAQYRSRPGQRPVARIVDSLGLVEERTYDIRGHLVTIQSGAGDVQWLYHDAEGMLSILIDPGGASTWFDGYGEHGHAQEILRGGVGLWRSFDEVGNLVAGPDGRSSVSPGRPGIQRRSFDEDRNLRTLEMAGDSDSAPSVQEAGEVIFSYRSDGKVLGIQRPHGGDAIFEYDAVGRLVERRERVDGAWQSSSYEYTAAGDLSAIELANGMRSEAIYDVAGRPTHLGYRRDGVLEQSVELGWDSGRLASLLDSRLPGVESLAYDAGGRSISVSFPDGEVLERDYDLRSRETARRFRMSAEAEPLRSLGFSYDLADRQTEVFDQGELILMRSFDQGRLAEVGYGNGLTQSFEYAPESNLLQASSLRDPGGWEIASTQMAWSECHGDSYCVVATTRFASWLDGPVPSIFSEENYVMGPRAEFALAEGGHGARLESWAQSFIGGPWSVGAPHYSFDALGNWLGVWQGEERTARFTYNAERNRLVGSDRSVHHEYAWDEAGFMAARDGVAFAWSAAGLLTGIGDSVELEFDSLGRPISIRTPTTISRSLFGGAVAGDANREPVSLDLGEVEIRWDSGERLYRHHDFRGNVQMVTNQAGQSTEFYTYSPFGVAQRYGEGLDSKSFAQGEALGDFLVLGSRVYDPETGRFLSPDPIYHPINQFAYTLGNPLNYWDPGGAAAEQSPMTHRIDLAKKAGASAGAMASILFAGGVSFSSVPLTLLGLGFMLVSALSRLVVIYYQFSVARGKVTIEDLPEGSGTQALDPNSSAEVMSVTDLVACSPLGLGGIGLGADGLGADGPGGNGRGENGRGSWWGSLVGLFQLGVAGLLMTWLRKRRGRLAP